MADMYEVTSGGPWDGKKTDLSNVKPTGTGSSPNIKIVKQLRRNWAIFSIYLTVIFEDGLSGNVMERLCMRVAGDREKLARICCKR